jgi:hypothetical protein
MSLNKFKDWLAELSTIGKERGDSPKDEIGALSIANPC